MKDIAKALHWHEAASRHGHVESAFSLGQLLLNSQGKKVLGGERWLLLLLFFFFFFFFFFFLFFLFTFYFI